MTATSGKEEEWKTKLNAADLAPPAVAARATRRKIYVISRTSAVYVDSMCYSASVDQYLTQN